MNSKLLLIKSEDWGVGVKRHWQGVQGKSWRQGQGWGEALTYQGRAHVWGREWPGLGMAMFSLPKAGGSFW